MFYSLIDMKSQFKWYLFASDSWLGLQWSEFEHLPVKAPSVPGVYRLRLGNTLAYIGESKNLHDRITTHGLADRRRQRQAAKSHRWPSPERATGASQNLPWQSPEQLTRSRKSHRCLTPNAVSGFSKSPRVVQPPRVRSFSN